LKEGTDHDYTTLHYTTLHYTTLHYTTLHYTTLHYTTLHYSLKSSFIQENKKFHVICTLIILVNALRKTQYANEKILIHSSLQILYKIFFYKKYQLYSNYGRFPFNGRHHKLADIFTLIYISNKLKYLGNKPWKQETEK
jgi:hypothetical protein